MCRRISAVALSLFCLFAAPQARQTPPPEALDGVDVVTLLTTGKEVFGKSAHRSTYEGFDYLFSGPETKAAFDKAPEKYAIQLGGMCARMGGMVTGNPSDYAVHAGKIYIFGSDTCHKTFVSDPESYIPRPTPPMPSLPEAIARGRALIEKAAAAHGGAALDAMTTYVEKVVTKQKRPTGEVDITTRTMWRFPGSVRSERTFPMNDGLRTVSTIVTSSAAWSVGMTGGVNALPPAARPAAQVQLGRQLLPILKTRQAADVAVAALDPATIDGVAVERVRLRREPIDVTLNIDAASGRVHSIAFVDRGASGKFGQILVTFGDFRDVGGISIPFAESVTVDGAPDTALSRTLESADVNAPLDPAIFTPPAEIGK